MRGLNSPIALESRTRNPPGLAVTRIISMISIFGKCGTSNKFTMIQGGALRDVRNEVGRHHRRLRTYLLSLLIYSILDMSKSGLCTRSTHERLIENSEVTSYKNIDTKVEEAMPCQDRALMKAEEDQQSAKN